MRDLFFEKIAMQRIELVTRLVTVGVPKPADREIAVDWIAELSADLLRKLDEYDKQNPQGGGHDSGLLQ